MLSALEVADGRGDSCHHTYAHTYTLSLTPLGASQFDLIIQLTQTQLTPVSPRSASTLALGLGSGVLIAVPCPLEKAASGRVIEDAIQQALSEAR